MGSPVNRLGLLLSQIAFSLITPFMLSPSIGRLHITRRLIAFFFGRLYGNRYGASSILLKGAMGWLSGWLSMGAQRGGI